MSLTNKKDSTASKKYVLFSSKGGSKNWFYQRKYRVTGSAIAGAVDRSIFSSPAKTALQMLGVYKTPTNAAMKHGNDFEPIARKWYEQEYHVQVKEVGFALSKVNTYLGVSVDGIVDTDGIIEIKCPQRMYPPLRDYTDSVNPDELSIDKTQGLRSQLYEHIYESHYLQMQLGMHILQRTWSDYIVYTEDEVFTQKVLYDKVYFEEILSILETNFLPAYQQVLRELNITLLSAKKGLVKGKVTNKQRAVDLVHKYLQEDCICDDDSVSKLDCCLHHS